jgi:hypothetical protein
MALDAESVEAFQAMRRHVEKHTQRFVTDAPRRRARREGGCTPPSCGVKWAPMSPPERKAPTPIGQEAPKSPADRVRLIQEMQRAAEVQAARPSAPQAPAQPQVAQPLQGLTVADGFTVAQVNAVQRALQAKPSSTEVNAYAKVQASAQALFGGSTDIEVTGNPWKVIPFGEVLPGLFDTDRPLSNYEPVVPEKAVKTDQGLLFEVGLKEKGGDGAVHKRAVLVDAQGKLAGAECRTPKQVQQLFSAAPWLLPPAASGKDTRWRVTAGQDSAFTLEVDRSSTRGRTTEAVPLNNFARPADARGRTRDLWVAQYFLDRFEAAVP